LGIEVADADIEDILQRLGFRLAAQDAGYAVRIPSFRPDVTREEDLIEEVGRHIGYDRLPATLPVIRAVDDPATPDVLGERRLKRCLSAAGCHEAMSSSLSSAKEQAVLLAPGQEPVALSNPISEGLGVLRAHICPGLLTAVAHNVNHGQSSLRLFELGRCFRGPLSDDGVNERWGLGIVLTGERLSRHWNDPAPAVDFYDLKGIVDGVGRQMAWPAWHWQAGERPALVPGATALLSADGGAASGWAGRLAPGAAASFGIGVEVWVAEIDVDALLPRPHPTARYEPMSRLPGGVRDVALLLPCAVTWQTLRSTAVAAAADAALPLVDTGLVEVYEGEEIPAGNRGMTLRLLFRAADRTLTAEEIDAAVNAIIERLASDCGARRR
jgi:phenylalanyl-tRNA synthetase beta chain